MYISEKKGEHKSYFFKNVKILLPLQDALLAFLMNTAHKTMKTLNKYCFIIYIYLFRFITRNGNKIMEQSN